MIMTQAEARVFNMTNEKFASYFLLTGGTSLIEKNAFAGEAAMTDTYSAAVAYNYTGEFGFLYATPSVSLRFGFEVFKPSTLSEVIATNASAVDTYLLELPDIVFLDIHMPGGSGLNALAEILLFDPTAHVVMLSADRVEATILDAKKFGAKGYVAKPFTPEKLIACYNKTPTVQKQAL